MRGISTEYNNIFELAVTKRTQVIRWKYGGELILIAFLYCSFVDRKLLSVQLQLLQKDSVSIIFYLSLDQWKFQRRVSAVIMWSTGMGFSSTSLQ